MMGLHVNGIKELLDIQKQMQNISFGQIMITLIMALLIGLFIFYIYKQTYSGTLYSYSFNASLITMTLITSMMILAISSNMLLALGMVGALSIVRFRAAIKNPVDVVYLFWAITVGITIGAALYYLAIIGSLFIAVVLVLISRFNVNLNAYLLVVTCENNALNDFYNKIKEIANYDIKSQTIINNDSELTIAVKGKLSPENLLVKINNIEGIKEASLLKYEE